MNKLQMLVTPVVTNPNPNKAGFCLVIPVGTRVLWSMLTGEEQSINVVVLADKSLRPVVHRVIVMEVGQPQNLMLGESIGEMIGAPFVVQGPRGSNLAALFKLEPWPKSTIEALAAEGTA